LDPKPDLDSQIIVRQRRECVQAALHDLPAEQRDVLERFYVLEQDPKQICAEMILSETQFRLLKWRAKTRFTAILQKRLRGQALASLARRSVGSAF
jgi:DNA-directed RNA polymerase specialized sigma24 family protein